ncbi:MAG: hypothetical protein UH543_00195 [Bacteroidales bacterium]|nr:hypothetical protein [Bacteroidales bacterium]
MKRTLLLAIALLMCGIAVSQEKEKKFTLSIQENLLSSSDIMHLTNEDYRESDYLNNSVFLNYIPSFELDYDNKYSARLRFNYLRTDKSIIEENGGCFKSFPHNALKTTYKYDHKFYSSSAVLGYNFLNESKAHRLKAGVILGGVYADTKGENYESRFETYSWHFQIGGELSYQYFLPSTNYRLGLGASCEYSYVNNLLYPHFFNFNLNASWKLFNF